jgi:GT2 family glycosyltransferase
MKNLGIVVVAYNAVDVIRDCLESLLAASAGAKVVVVNNASTDDTAQVLEKWRAGRDGYKPDALPFAVKPVSKPLQSTDLTLIDAPHNGGFAAGVNIGLKRCLADSQVDRVWVVNPDTLTPAGTPQAIADAPADFALMGGRILYAAPPHRIQIDGGTIDRWTGVTGNLNLGAPRDADPSAPNDMAFISGASMVASRRFIEAAGPMPECYFLYYEEVDWALKRGNLPLTYCREAVVYHHAGTAIGSPTLDALPSPFSAYYKHRARMMFLKRHFPASVPVGYLYGLAKTAQSILKGHPALGWAILCGLHGVRRPR